LALRAKAVRPTECATGVCRPYPHRRPPALIDPLLFSPLSPLSLVFVSVFSVPNSVRHRPPRYALSWTAAGEQTTKCRYCTEWRSNSPCQLRPIPAGEAPAFWLYRVNGVRSFFAFKMNRRHLLRCQPNRFRRMKMARSPQRQARAGILALAWRCGLAAGFALGLRAAAPSKGEQ
jgi:hypothetical protein